MLPENSIEIIINFGSGANDKDVVFRRLTELFGDSGLNSRISIANTGKEAVELARRAVQRKAETIVAGGGDGTVNAVASKVVGTDKTLGVLPLGTFNHFARDLRIPLDLEGAVQTIIVGHTAQVDVGEVNGHIFLNNSSLGLYPSIVSERKKQQRLGFEKWPAFVWAAFTVLRRYPFLTVRLNADGKKFAIRTPFVFVGNNEYDMEGFNIGARSRLDAGKLSLYSTRSISRVGLMRLALRALLGGLPREQDFIALCSEEIWIDTRHHRLRVATDGEVTVMLPPLHYHIRPFALRVLVPQQNETRGE